MTIHPMLLEWCFAREVCRRLGFSAEEIYFACAPSGRVLENGVELRFDLPLIALEIRRGGLTFIWTIGPVDLPIEQIEPAYQAACTAWNEGTVATVDEFQASKPFLQAIPLMLALQRKGFRIRQPRENN